MQDLTETKTIAERARLPTASNYQVTIFEAVETAVNKIMDGEIPESMIINAKPGSGKTTTGVAATRLIPAELSSIFVAFNKKIADELATRLPIGFPARTFHSHWLRQWGAHCREMHKQSVMVQEYKVKNLAEKRLGLSRFQRITKKTDPAEAKRLRALRERLENVCFLVDKAKIFGVVPRDYPYAESVGEYDDDDYFWSYICEYFGYEIDEAEFDDTVAIARLVLADDLDNELEIDFADMIYLPAVKRVNSENFQVVMIDEAQDLDSIQRYLLGQMVAPGGMIIAIGDKRQSIYAFRGADAFSMDNIQNAFGCVEYPLSISYRCAKSIVDLAYKIYPEIEAHPEAPDGSVEYPQQWKTEDFKPGHLIICRNNAPTVKLAYKLIRQKIPAKVLGRDIGEGLIKLVKKCDVDGSLPEMMSKLVAWKERQLGLAERKDPDDVRSKEAVMDRYECISNLCANPEIDTVVALIDAIDNMFASREDEKIAVSPHRVTLSTIHKIKGAESDTVFILDVNLINPPWVKNDWQFVQEENLRFVAVTRAKTRLVFITSDIIV